jgi:hypothetical protein
LICTEEKEEEESDSCPSSDEEDDEQLARNEIMETFPFHDDSSQEAEGNDPANVGREVAQDQTQGPYDSRGYQVCDGTKRLSEEFGTSTHAWRS